jgi:hypothetical protein
MLIAYPIKDVGTEFEFEYWVADISDDLINRLENLNFDGKDGQTLFFGLILGIVLIILLLCCLGYCCLRMCFRQQSS